MLRCISWGKLYPSGINIVGICRAGRMRPLWGPRSTTQRLDSKTGVCCSSGGADSQRWVLSPLPILVPNPRMLPLAVLKNLIIDFSLWKNLTSTDISTWQKPNICSLSRSSTAVLWNRPHTHFANQKTDWRQNIAQESANVLGQTVNILGCAAQKAKLKTLHQDL